jgi:hypothetical protein
MVPCAYLRVFEPLDAFPEVERERWGAYVASGQGLTVGAALEAEEKLAAARLVSGRQPSAAEVALVRRVGRRVHVCPLEVAERHAVALVAFGQMLPDVAIDAFVSAEEARTASVAVHQLQRPPHIQECSWEVPLKWFAAFDPRERHFTNPAEGTGPRVTYLTVVEAALARLDRAIEVVDATIEDADTIIDALSDLVEWLASFDDESLLELDYGGLTALVPASDLATDLSCDELWDAIEGLERGDASTAFSRYEVVAGRWQMLRQRVREN